MKHSILSSIPIWLALSSTAFCAYSPFSQVAQRYEEQSSVEPVEQTVYSYGTPAAYQFAYNTGSGSSADASHFREESRDARGLVVGKYGYVDPYGKLRVVSYTAGPQGFVASGDIGPDQEVLRQQRELYAADPSYQIQQQVWQQLATGQQQQQVYGVQSNNAASSSSSSSSSSNGGSEWTSVNDATVVGSSGDYTTGTKGQSSRFAERYTAAGGSGIKSPVAAYREQTTVVTAPVVQTTAIKSIKSSSGSSSAAAASAAASSAYTAPAVSQTVYSTKTVQQPIVQTAAIKQHSYSYQIPAQRIVVQPARLVQPIKTVQQQQYTTGYYQSPAARLVALNQGASSSSASAAASASASASSGAYTAGVKGYSGAIKSAPLRVAPVKVARYTDAVPSGRGHTVVNFQQGGPVPYKYSYSFK